MDPTWGDTFQLKCRFRCRPVSFFDPNYLVVSNIRLKVVILCFAQVPTLLLPDCLWFFFYTLFLQMFCLVLYDTAQRPNEVAEHAGRILGRVFVSIHGSGMIQFLDTKTDARNHHLRCDFRMSLSTCPKGLHTRYYSEDHRWSYNVQKNVGRLVKGSIPPLCEGRAALKVVHRWLTFYIVSAYQFTN